MTDTQKSPSKPKIFDFFLRISIIFCTFVPEFVKWGIVIRLSQIMINRTYPESGQVLYNTMVPLLSADQQVVLDMADVISLPSMFLNASIGMAAQKYGVDKVKKSVVFHHVTKAQAERLKDYFARL